jgi:signal transduction histidine kinase
MSAVSFSRLAAGLAHEVRNPLNTLSLTLQFLERVLGRERLDRGEEVRHYLSQAVEEATRVQRIIDAFVAATDCSDLAPEPVDLAAAAAAAGREAGRPVEVSAPRDPVVLDLDPGALGRALRAAIVNAAEASPPDAPVTVRVERTATPGGARVTVADAGPGFGAAALARIPEPFFTTKAGHAGLGLARAAAAVEAQGGRLGFRNGPAGGAEVIFEFPGTR